MHRHQILTALNRPASMLGVLPELSSLRPVLDIHVYDALGSTNQEAWQLIEQGYGAGTAVIARQQSAGRGQWGRTWISEPGGLYCSLILEPDLAVEQGFLLTLASAWGIATSLENLGIALQVKWPNDLVSNGRKVGGVLCQIRTAAASQTSASQGISWAIVGVGLNWDNPLPENALSIRQLLPDGALDTLKDLEDLAAIALRGILQGYYYWQQQGTASLVNVYQQKLSCLAREICVSGHPGLVTGVSDQGDLAVAVDHLGQKTVRYFKPGEISLGYNI